MWFQNHCCCCFLRLALPSPRHFHFLLLPFWTSWQKVVPSLRLTPNGSTVHGFDSFVLWTQVPGGKSRAPGYLFMQKKNFFFVKLDFGRVQCAGQTFAMVPPLAGRALRSFLYRLFFCHIRLSDLGCRTTFCINHMQ